VEGWKGRETECFVREIRREFPGKKAAVGDLQSLFKHMGLSRKGEGAARPQSRNVTAKGMLGTFEWT